jgi:outer membrane receptor protein involved in Fe transport
MHARTALCVAAAVCLGGNAMAQTAPTTRPVATSNPSTQPATNPLEDSDRQLAEMRKATEKAAAASTVPATDPVAAPVVAATAPSAPATNSSAAAAASDQGNIIVTSPLEMQRSNIAPPLGARTYTIGPAQIADVPQGENATFQQVLLRAPGVVEDSYGQVHVRGEHANLTYDVNGILLPEGLNAFGQELDTRLIQSVTLTDGSLPAQYGFRTAGIVNVETKTGENLKSNEISFYGGSQETYEPSAQFGGAIGKLDYFVTFAGNHNNLGIENTTASTDALHDRTNQERGFVYLSYHIDDTSRLSLIVNGSYSDFQIPDTAGLPPLFALAGHPNVIDSTGINENQNEQQYYEVLAYQKSYEKLSFQAAVFSRFGAIHFVPDEVNDLVFQGVAGEVHNTYFNNGAQFDASYILNDLHTIRAGFLGNFTSERLDTNTDVFATDPVTGAVATNMPSYIADNSGNHGISAGVYLQDEWHLTRKLTVNFGGRYDRFDTNFADTGQFSPRANLVYKFDNDTTGHVGYARYFVPPPLQYVGPGTVNKFANTTNAPQNFVSDPLKVERSNYYDIGLSHQFTKAWKVDVDGFYKQAHNLVDNGQFGAPVIITPFNYRLGQVFGAEFSTNYTQGPFATFFNFSYVNTLGKDVISQQYLFSNAELAYIHNHYIKLDHEGEYTASLGFSYTLKNDMVYVDSIYGSGLRRGFANTGKEPEYMPVNIGYQHMFHVNESAEDVVKLRVDILNVLNESYQIRDGSGVGVAAAQYGARRAFYAGISYDF